MKYKRIDCDMQKHKFENTVCNQCLYYGMNFLLNNIFLRNLKSIWNMRRFCKQIYILSSLLKVKSLFYCIRKKRVRQ